MLCPQQGANCCYIDNVKLLQDLIKNDTDSDRMSSIKQISKIRDT